MGEMPAPPLSLLAAGRRFGAVVVLDAVDLTLAGGHRVALVGSNGAGKSTLLRCVAGTLALSSGQALVGGHVAGSLAARRLLGASFSQERSFYLRLTGRQNLRCFARMRGHTAAAAARAVASLELELELESVASKRVDRCSSGMIQQLALARALLGGPRLLLLDEPTRSLDGAAIGRFWAALERRPEMAVLIATHREEDLDHCHERLDLSR